MRRWIGLGVVALWGVGLNLGCRGATAVKFQYHQPPACELPASVTSLAVADLAEAPGSQGWGRTAAQRLAEGLGRAEHLKRLRIVGAASQPAPQAVPVADTTSAVRWGRASGVDAVAYGAVSITFTGQPGSADGRADVTVSFVIDDVKTARTLAAASFSRRYPQEGQTPVARADLASGDALGMELIDQCVDSFLAWLGPQTVSVSDRLQVGRTRRVLEGNTHARAGRYAQALDCYLAAMRESPGDDGAVFNAGLMHEALGQLGQARVFYDRAARMRPNDQYDQARRRLGARGESQ